MSLWGHERTRKQLLEISVTTPPFSQDTLGVYHTYLSIVSLSESAQR